MCRTITTAVAALLVAGCSQQPPLPLASDDLAQMPGVARVTSNQVSSPTRRIVQIVDWHFVDREPFVADLTDQRPHTEDEVERFYEEHLDLVAAVQADQTRLLEHLMAQHGIEAVYIEGLSQSNADKFARQLETFKGVRIDPESDDPLDQFIAGEYRLDMLRIGAAGRLAMKGKLRVLPVEDEDVRQAANPLAGGKVEFSDDANERREDAIVRNLLAGPRVAILVLGGGHDLTDNIERLEPECEYVRVYVAAHPDADVETTP